MSTRRFRQPTHSKPTQQVWKPKPPLFNFTLLPAEIQCQILSYPLTLTEFNELRILSKETQKYIEDCLISIDSKGTADKGYLLSDVVLKHKKLESIRGNYFVVVSSYQQLVALAKHEKLKVASFNINKIISEGGNIYDAVLAFATNLNNPSSSSCQVCEQTILPTTYQIYFWYTDAQKMQHIIKLTEHSLTILNVSINPEDFFSRLNENLTICTFKGYLNYGITGLEALSCLNSIYLLFDVDMVLPNYNLFMGGLFIIIDMPSLEEFAFSYTAKDRNLYFDFISDILNMLGNEDVKYPKITHISTLMLDNVDYGFTIFPNLEVIEISVTSIDILREEDPADFILKIQSIVNQIKKNKDFVVFLIDDADERLTPEDLSLYKDYFPEIVRNKIHYEKSDRFFT